MKRFLALFLLAAACGSADSDPMEASDPIEESPITMQHVCETYVWTYCGRAYDCVAATQEQVGECVTENLGVCCQGEQCEAGVNVTEAQLSDCEASIYGMTCDAWIQGVLPNACSLL